MNKWWLTNNLGPAIVWTVYHLSFVPWHFSFFGALVLMRALVVLICLLIRRTPQATSSRPQVVISWLSTALPTLMIWGPQQQTVFTLVGELIAVLGTLLFIWTCIDLGSSFGVSPAIRGRVDGGIYQYFRNPMYLSHCIVEFGILVASPSLWNLSIMVIAWSLYKLRCKWEAELFALHPLTKSEHANHSSCKAIQSYRWRL